VRAFVITGPFSAEVRNVAEPTARSGEVVVAVERAGVCGTDMEFFSGEMAYLKTGEASYPIRIGHEWCGTVRAVGDGVDPSWLGRRVTGDTMLGCQHCERCRAGRAYLCADRHEIGIRNGWPGALAEMVPVPAFALQPLPSTVDATLGALVEPGANALRAVRAAGLRSGERLLVVGPGTIGLLVALISESYGFETHVLGLSLDFARSLGLARAWTADTVPRDFDAVIDASNGDEVPSLAVDLVSPGGRVVYIGLSEAPSLVDTRRVVLKDLTVVGILGGSSGLAGIIELYASGAVDPRPLVAATVGLDDVAAVLADPSWGPAPKIHIDPRHG
jgi:threonine dehydrogenase-like Zn-dependent dehydrogenase